MLDLSRQLEPIRNEIDDAMRAVVDSCRFILGADVGELETEIANYCSTDFAVGCASGSDALILALRSLGVAQGDEVITSAYSFYATAGAIWHVGARPVFVDIEPNTFNIDPSLIASKITNKTKAIMPVHLFGQMADMTRIQAVAGSIPIIEDSAQSLGARWNDIPAGNWGKAACLSFFPAKNLGAFGDGGMILTNDEQVHKHCRLLRVHGAVKTYLHECVGYNSRLDTLQAAILRVKLRYLDDWAMKRRENARFYTSGFEGSKVKTPFVHPNAISVFNQYVICVEDRDMIRQKLADNGISSAVYYPIPLPLQPCFSFLGYEKGDFPNSEYTAAHSLAIPVFPELTRNEIQQVMQVILDNV